MNQKGLNAKISHYIIIVKYKQYEDGNYGYFKRER